MVDWLVAASYFLSALLSAVALACCFALTLHWVRNREEGLLPYVFYTVYFVVAVGVYLSDRNLQTSSQLSLAPSPRPDLVVWASRASSMFILLAAMERIARYMIKRGRESSPPTLLLLAFCLYFLTNIVSAAALGTYPTFSHEFIYPLLAGCAALLVTSPAGDAAVRSARNALYVFLFISAACIAWKPELVLMRGYQGVIPGFDVRYAGLGSHPNALGSMVVTFLLCLWVRPYRLNWLNAAAWLIGGASLILTQSKTSWVAFAVCAFCIAYFKRPASVTSRSAATRHLQRASGFLAAAATITTAAIVLGIVGVESLGVLEEIRVGNDLWTLSGRDLIWQAALEEWRANPLFGYGLNIWNDDYRTRLGLPEAFHAHNQFYQALASAGLLGVSGLVIYTLILVRFALTTANESEGLSLALVALILIRSISEVPLAIGSFGPEQLTHLLMLMVIASYWPQRSMSREPERVLC